MTTTVIVVREVQPALREITTPNRGKRIIATNATQKLLANQVMEQFEIVIG